MPTSQAMAFHRGVSIEPPRAIPRMASITNVIGWLLAKAWSQPGMVEIGTKAELRNVTGNSQIRPNACTDSSSPMARPVNAAIRQQAMPSTIASTTMPMARSAVLTGRLVADTLRMAVTILVLIAVGYAVGFRFHNGVAAAIAMIVLAVVFGVAISCISAFLGLTIGDEESVQAFGLIWIFPITFLSSAFVPISSMPGWLQAFANNQPVTYTIDAMRALALGGPVEASLWKSLVWLAGIFIVFVPLAVRAYRRAS